MTCRVHTTKSSSPRQLSGTLSRVLFSILYSGTEGPLCRGLIGPNRQFGSGSIYHFQLYAIIIGALLPIPFWLWQRRRPDSWVKYVSIPIILNGVSFIPPATGINYSSWFFVGFIFQYLIRRRNFGWWSKFNYVTSAALDSGTVLSLIFIFFTLQVRIIFSTVTNFFDADLYLQFPKGGKIEVNWWGNLVYQNSEHARPLERLTLN